MAYIQFAAGYGNFDALDAIPVILWFGVPILSSIGMYHPSFSPLIDYLLTVAAVVQNFHANTGSSYSHPRISNRLFTLE